MTKKRCSWVEGKSKSYIDYHDKEWGKKVKKEEKLFEMLTLEGAQAGLSWETVLKKREAYQKLFKNFELKRVTTLSEAYLEKILLNPEIIRNRRKVFSTKQNAIIFIQIQKEFGSFYNFLTKYTGKKQIINCPKNLEDVPAKTKLSEAISKDLKKRGMNFVGPTIIYAFLQASGFVNDHMSFCFRHPKNLKKK